MVGCWLYKLFCRESLSNKTKRETEEVRLIGFWASGFSKRVELALRAKGIQFDYVEEDIFNKSELLLSSNPVSKKVPILVHNGKSICESRLIIEYIDETWPTEPRLLPHHPYDRYLLRFWSDFIDKKFTEIMREAFKHKFKSEEEKEVVMKKMGEDYTKIGLTLERGLEELEKKGCLYHEGNLKYMDVFFAPSIPWFSPTRELLGFNLPEREKSPHLHRWIQNLLGNELVKSTLQDDSKLTEYAKILWC